MCWHDGGDDSDLKVNKVLYEDLLAGVVTIEHPATGSKRSSRFYTRTPVSRPNDPFQQNLSLVAAPHAKPRGQGELWLPIQARSAGDFHQKSRLLPAHYHPQTMGCYPSYRRPA